MCMISWIIAPTIGSGLIFDETGAVMPCNLFTSHPVGKFGVDFSNPSGFEKFWARRELSTFRKKVGSYPDQKCVGCGEWDMCGGGCKIKWMYWDPQQYIKGLPLP